MRGIPRKLWVRFCRVLSCLGHTQQRRVIEGSGPCNQHSRGLGIGAWGLASNPTTALAIHHAQLQRIQSSQLSSDDAKERGEAGEFCCC